MTAHADNDAPTSKTALTRRLVVAAAALLVVGAAVAIFDAGVSQALTTAPWHERVEKPMNFVLSAGAVLVLFAILGSLPNAARLCGGFVIVMVSSTAILHALKWALGRARPNAGLGPWHFEPFSSTGDFDGFPSGHTTSAFTFALLLGMYFPRFRVMFYALAAATALERVVSGYHYPSDVVAGVALACGVVAAFRRWLGPRWFSTGLTG